MIIQLDGGDSSSDDDDVDDDDEDEEGAEAEGEGEIEEEPLNSEDDDTDGDEEPNLFEMDNVVVCQYDKVMNTYVPCGCDGRNILLLRPLTHGSYFAILCPAAILYNCQPIQLKICMSVVQEVYYPPSLAVPRE